MSKSYRLRGYVLGIAVPLICTLIDWPLRHLLGEASILMTYLLAVFLVASRYGFGPSITASLLSAPLFAFYFARPIFSFAIADLENMVGLGVMMTVASITSNLVDKVRSQAKISQQRESRASALYLLSEALANTSDKCAVASVAVEHIHNQFDALSVLLYVNEQGDLVYPDTEMLSYSLAGVNMAEAQQVFMGQKKEFYTDSQSLAYYRLESSQMVFAVLVIKFTTTLNINTPELNAFFDTFRHLITQTLERLYLAEQAKEAILQAETEALRNALLSAISHDLRTPLTRITGAASALVESDSNVSDEEKQEFGKAIFDEAQHMSDLTSKILDMARLSSGKIILHQDWNAIEEIVGSALTRLDKNLQDRPVRTFLPGSLPLVWVDAVLMEQVLVNLVENAIKYTPSGSPIDIGVEFSSTRVRLFVSDYGSGIPKGMEDKLFEKFYRIDLENKQGGVGLGLALCRSIVEAHNGSIKVVNQVGKGAGFIIDLPLHKTQPLNWDEVEMATP